MNNINILIATPCYGGQMTVGYTNSLLGLLRELECAKISWSVKFLANESLITRARNYFVSLFLADKTFTHLLFIDADISYDPKIIHEMLASGKDVVAAPYPKKGLDWDLINRIDLIIPFINNYYKTRTPNSTLIDEIYPLLLSYAVNIPLKTKSHGNFIQAKYAATGFMLIKKSVIETLIKAYPKRNYISTNPEQCTEGNGDLHYDLFTVMIHPTTREYLSEDYAFCYLCELSRIEIWVYKNAQMTHTGTYNFVGDFGKYMKSITKPTAS